MSPSVPSLLVPIGPIALGSVLLKLSSTGLARNSLGVRLLHALIRPLGELWELWDPHQSIPRLGIGYRRDLYICVCPLIITPGGITSGHMNLRILNIYMCVCVHNFAYTPYNAEFRQESDFEVKHRCYQRTFLRYFIHLPFMLLSTVGVVLGSEKGEIGGQPHARPWQSMKKRRP